MELLTNYLEEIKTRIINQVHPLKIILFGSYARGDYGPDSDLDILVVLAKVENKHKDAVAIGSLLADLPVSKDVFVTTPYEFEQSKDRIGSILRPARQEGKVIYELS